MDPAPERHAPKAVERRIGCANRDRKKERTATQAQAVTDFAAESWYVAHPDLTVAEIHQLKRIAKAVDEFLDEVG
jgi:hypothetical protein